MQLHKKDMVVGSYTTIASCANLVWNVMGYFSLTAAAVNIFFFFFLIFHIMKQEYFLKQKVIGKKN